MWLNLFRFLSKDKGDFWGERLEVFALRQRQKSKIGNLKKHLKYRKIFCVYPHVTSIALLLRPPNFVCVKGSKTLFVVVLFLFLFLF
jgi:hypothetical protein